MVEITALRPRPSFSIPTDEEAAGLDDAVPTEQFIPRRFNIETTLSINVDSDRGGLSDNDYVLTSE